MNEITKVGPEQPSWLNDYKDKDRSLEAVLEYKILPRIKVIQSLTDQDMKDRHGGEGAVVLMPLDMLVTKPGKIFQFVPIFAWTEFCHWADRNDKTQPAVIAKTFDKTSEIARRASDAATREQIYPGQETAQRPMKYRWVQHLNFAGWIYGEHPLAGTECVLHYERGEFTQGQNFISQAALRRAPLWAQVWSFSSSLRDRRGNKWWGLDHHIPDVPFIQEDEADHFKAMHEQNAAWFASKGGIVVDYTGEDLGETDPEVAF